MEGRHHLFIFYFFPLCSIWALSRPGHVSTAVVQTASSANCKVSRSRRTLWSWVAGQRRALFCDKKDVETESILGTISTDFCGGANLSLILCGLLALLTCDMGGANLF